MGERTRNANIGGQSSPLGIYAEQHRRYDLLALPELVSFGHHSAGLQNVNRSDRSDG